MCPSLNLQPGGLEAWPHKHFLVRFTKRWKLHNPHPDSSNSRITEERRPVGTMWPWPSMLTLECKEGPSSYADFRPCSQGFRFCRSGVGGEFAFLTSSQAKLTPTHCSVERWARPLVLKEVLLSPVLPSWRSHQPPSAAPTDLNRRHGLSREKVLTFKSHGSLMFMLPHC